MSIYSKAKVFNRIRNLECYENNTLHLNNRGLTALQKKLGVLSFGLKTADNRGLNDPW